MEQNNQTPNKYVQAFADSKVETNDAVVAAEVEKIVSQHMAENDNKQVYEFLLNCVDLTTLSTTGFMPVLVTVVVSLTLAFCLEMSYGTTCCPHRGT